MTVALITVAAAMTIWFWALTPLGFVSYLTSPGTSDANIIRQYWPNRLVQPEWVSTTPDRLINWHVTEAAARLGVVAVSWLFVAGGATYGLARKKGFGIEAGRRRQRSRTGNDIYESFQGTVGALR